MLNLIIGIILIIMGLSGQFRLIGTNSPGLLVLLGIAMAGWGAFQIYRRRHREE
jgi:hypothetical protein